jgi:diadenosine hexaphosphate hydrolase (ATP-forming)
MSAPSHATTVTGAGGIVFSARGHVLVLRHQSGAWVFPKGHIDPGESALEAALREVEEEAGVQAECDDPSATFVTRYLNDRQERREITWFVLSTQASEPTLRETLFPAGGFYVPSEALTRLSYAEDKRLLREVLAWRARHLEAR